MRRTARALSVALLAGAGLFIAGPAALAGTTAEAGPGTGPPSTSAPVPCDPAGPVPDTLAPASGGFGQGAPCEGGGYVDDGTQCREGESCPDGAQCRESENCTDGGAAQCREGESCAGGGATQHDEAPQHDGATQNDGAAQHDGSTQCRDGDTCADGAGQCRDGGQCQGSGQECAEGRSCAGAGQDCGDSHGEACSGGHTCQEPGEGTDCEPATVEHGAHAGEGGTFADSVPALVAGGVLIVAACGGAVHRLYGRRSSTGG